MRRFLIYRLGDVVPGHDGQPRVHNGAPLRERLIMGTYDGSNEADALAALAQDEARVKTEAARRSWYHAGDFMVPVPAAVAVEHLKAEDHALVEVPR
jgi:hypothetical protein